MDPHLRRSRALASPLRLRILRVCLHDARTNKEIADTLGIAPATCLHHVRTLVETGYLEAQEERRGNRGAREVPYLATRKSAETSNPMGITPEILLSTTLAEVAGLDASETRASRIGFKIPHKRREEFHERLMNIVEELHAEPTDDDAEAWSLLVLSHRDPSAD